MNATTSIKTTLLKGVMLIVLFFLVQGGIVWYATSSAKAVVVENTRKNTLATKELGTLAILAQQIRRYEKEYFIYIDDEKKRDGYEHEWRDAHAKISDALKEMKTGSDGTFSASDVEQIIAWSDAAAFYGSEMNNVFGTVTARMANQQSPAVNAGSDSTSEDAVIYAGIVPAAIFRPVDANKLIAAGKDQFATLIKGVAAMDKAKSADTLTLADVAEDIFDSLLIGVLITVAIGIGIAVLLARRLPKSVMASIDHLSDAAQEMSLGNLGRPCDSGGVIEFDKLAESLDRLRLGQQMMVERLRRLSRS